nr:N-acetylglucosaminidase [Bacillus timonensis]
MVSIQSKVNAQTDLYRNEPSYVHKENITLVEGNPNKGKITGKSSIYVYEGTSKDSRVVGSIKFDEKSEAEVSIKSSHGDWYEVVYGPWKNAKDNDIKYYVNPSNFSEDDFQFLSLSQNTGISASEINSKILSNSGILTGKGQSFVDGSKQYKVNELYLISHALHETGHGTSALSNGSIEVGEIEQNKYVSFQSGKAYVAEYYYDGLKWTWKVNEETNFDRSKAKNIKKTYNMFGIGAVDSAPATRGSVTAYQNGWFTPEAAIIGGAKYIGEKYIHHSTYKQDTLYKMRWNPATPGTHQYASDIGWATKQVDDLVRMYKNLDYYTLYFDVPVYKN